VSRLSRIGMFRFRVLARERAFQQLLVFVQGEDDETNMLIFGLCKVATLASTHQDKNICQSTCHGWAALIFIRLLFVERAVEPWLVATGNDRWIPVERHFVYSDGLVGFYHAVACIISNR
jgi:hypothetical protein